MNEIASPNSPKAGSPLYVVGIGASAGGLESLEKLFLNVPSNTGMAFVVIQHLSPDFKSMMYELLARDTNMAIHRVEDGMTVEANNIYLLPPKKEMVIAGGTLRLIDKDLSKGLTLPIDRFLESLAREWGPRGIGIILSGSGSDGSRGVRDLYQAGGLVICESTTTAKFDGMPLSAQATGMVDMVLTPQEMGRALTRHAASPLDARRTRERDTNSFQFDLSETGLDAIRGLLKHEYSIDFSLYKEATVQRRIGRRVAMSHLANVEDYADSLRWDKAELSALYQDLLIGVTQFFRDEQAFQFLQETVMPELILKQSPDRTIRVWVAACATGEEVYSLAIAFHEAFAAVGRPPQLKIFATDIHDKSLIQAGRGTFSQDAMRHVPKDYIDRYFVRSDDHYQISNDLREQIVFAPHNLLRDAPFTDLDFVSCRNLLIYLQPSAQMKTLSLFHFGLNTDGILFLGNSESPGELASEFATVHEHHKVYKKWRQTRLPAELRMPSVRPVSFPPRTAALRSFNLSGRGAETDLLKVYDHLLQRYMPPTLLVNDQHELVESFGGAESLLKLRKRHPTLNVLDLVESGLRTTLLGALQRVAKTDAKISLSGVKLNDESTDRSYTLTVEPFRRPSDRALQFLITLDGNEPLTGVALTTPTEAPPTSIASTSQWQQLEEDLRYTRENLQATIEELETSNEELQATNEELTASNEELQSTNEELHSVNEELYTVNAEHQRKIAELAEVNQDMFHLLENTDVATIFLDQELRIRKFTSRIRQIFDLLDQDVGRPISSFSHRIHLEDFLEGLKQARDSGKAFETEVHTIDGEAYLLRILPYRVERVINGVVISLVDLSALEDLRGRLRWMSSIVTSTDDAIIGEDLAGVITSWNVGAQHLFGYTAEEAVGRHITLLIPPGREGEVSDYTSQILNGESVRTLDTVRVRQDGSQVHVSLTISPVRDAVNRVIGISKIARDMTEHVKTESKLRDQAAQREMFLAMLSHELRNPLSAVLSAVGVLGDRRASAKHRTRAIATVQRQTSMMAMLLDDLLDVSRISLGKITLSRKVFNLTDLAASIVETTQPEITQHQTQLHFDIQERELFVNADWARLLQIHVNLIHNAAKYSPPGSHIQVTMRSEGEWAVVSVRDEGSGIPAEFLPRIFEPFVQSDETLDRSEGGLGVGLTLVKNLVELHDGSIEAYSDGRDTGSTFLLRIPLTHLRPSGSIATVEFVESDAIPSVATPAPRADMQVVLIEDLEDIREMLQAILELDGFQVTTAADGAMGCQAILSLRPQVALVDIGLPGMDGYEVARRVRQNPECDRVRLVALTGYGQPADVEKAFAAGFDDHLVKPIDPVALARLLAQT